MLVSDVKSESSLWDDFFDKLSPLESLFKAY